MVQMQRPGPECFTSEPDKERARTLHVAYRSMLRAKMLRALQAGEQGLKSDLAHIRGRFEALSPETRLSPAAYVAFTQLADALGSDSVTRVVDAIQAVRIVPDETLLDAEFRMESVLSEPWERGFIDHVRGQPTGETSKDTPILRPILSPDIPELSAARDALALLREVDPAMADEFDEFVCRVKVFDGQGYYGFSSPAAFGAVFMRLPDSDPVEYFLEHLVHECSHLTLNAIMAHDPLLENKMQEGKAPLRRDLRPMFQILQAAFVLSRNVRVSRRVVQAHPELGYDKGLKYFEKKYNEGMGTLKASGRFSEMGKQLLETLEPL